MNKRGSRFRVQSSQLKEKAFGFDLLKPLKPYARLKPCAELPWATVNREL